MSQASPLRSNLDVRTLVMVHIRIGDPDSYKEAQKTQSADLCFCVFLCLFVAIRSPHSMLSQRSNDLVRTLRRHSLVIIEVHLQHRREVTVTEAFNLLNSEL